MRYIELVLVRQAGGGNVFRTLIVTLCLSFAPILVAMDLEDCLKLKSYYLEKDSVVEQKIDEIDVLIRQDPRDAFLYLAKTTLLTIMASNSGTADAALAERMLKNLALFQNMQPANPFGMMYRGAALAYKAKSSHYLFEQLGLISDAMSNFDQGLHLLEGTSYEWWARSMRGSSYAQFPSALGKRDTALADLSYIEREFARNPALIGEAIVAFYYLGEIQSALGHADLAMKYWKRAASLNQGSALSEGRKAEYRVRKG